MDGSVGAIVSGHSWRYPRVGIQIDCGNLWPSNGLTIIVGMCFFSVIFHHINHEYLLPLASDKSPYCGCGRSFNVLLDKKQFYIKRVTPNNIDIKWFSDTPIPQP